MIQANVRKSKRDESIYLSFFDATLITSLR